MKVSYFPGCTLRAKAQALDAQARACAKLVDVELCEIENWQCCGGVFVTAKDEIASKLAGVRALKAAQTLGQPLVTVCSACHNVIKQTNDLMLNDADFASKVNRYMAQDKDFSGDYHGETQVLHYLELLRDVVGFDKLRARVQRPLTGKKVAAYYGCLLLRPGKVMRMDDPENPRIMEDFIRALGAEPVRYAYRNECCGAYVALEDREAASNQVDRALNSAIAAGAQELVTACPLCMYNLVENATGAKLPVKYFTELLAEALGVKEG